MPSDRLRRVLADDYAAGVRDLPIAEVRARRAECQEVELGLSYARRLVQGRLDILHAEIEHRAGGAAPGDVADLVDRLKEGRILGDHARPPGSGRLPAQLAPEEGGDEFTAEIDDVAGPDALARLPDLPDDALRDLADRLTGLERSLSDRRRQVFDRIDVFQGEIVERYKTGAASTDELLA